MKCDKCGKEIIEEGKDPEEEEIEFYSLWWHPKEIDPECPADAVEVADFCPDCGKSLLDK